MACDPYAFTMQFASSETPSQQRPYRTMVWHELRPRLRLHAAVALLSVGHSGPHPMVRQEV